jgi:dipeptide/tripeptide permease
MPAEIAPVVFLAESALEPADARAFFGHPAGLADLAFMEAFERFSFYGTQASRRPRSTR